MNETGAGPGIGEGNAGRVFLHLVTGACLLFSIFLVTNNIYPTRQRLTEMEREKERLEREIDARRDEIERLNLKSHALEHDPITIEAEHRRTFNLTREGEKTIRFPGEDD